MKKMNIYFGCALKHAPEEYKTLIELFKQRIAKETIHNVMRFVTDPNASNSDVYINDIKECIGNADVVVADVTYPSLGLGYEIATQFEHRNKPVILLAKKGSQISKVILGMPNAVVHFYEDLEEMIRITKNELLKITTVSQGKLVVIDGTDGSGKATQTKLLVDRLKQEGKRVETFDFPRYQNHFGKLIGECLAGKHGDFAGMSPYVASVLYAADRFHASQMIKDWLSEGVIVILDRYVSANQIHQGGKIHDEETRKQFLSWLDHMEHGIFKIPRPDLIVYLDVPAEISQQLVKEKAASSKKIYTKGNDQHEDNLQHLKDAKESGLKMVAAYNTWERISCYNNDQMLPIESIHERIWNIVKPIIN